MADDELEDEPPRAWNPFTPGGVAMFANAPLGQLLTVQIVTALLVFLSGTFYLHRSWASAIDSAVENLPAGSALNQGWLHIPRTNTLPLATNHLVGITWSTADAPGSTSDIELRLQPTRWQISTLFGYATLPYPRDISQPIDRKHLLPLWGAWRSAVVPLIAAFYTAGVVFSWIILAMIYAWPLRVLIFFRDKLTSRLGCWKLCAAALLPGALLMAAATTFYTLGQIPVVGVVVAFVAHIVLGWAYVFCGAIALPFIPEAERMRANPFDSKTKPRKPRRNPFHK